MPRTQRSHGVRFSSPVGATQRERATFAVHQSFVVGIAVQANDAKLRGTLRAVFLLRIRNERNTGFAPTEINAPNEIFARSSLFVHQVVARCSEETGLPSTLLALLQQHTRKVTQSRWSNC